MNLNGKAISWAAVAALIQSLPVTYYAQNPHPTNWFDILKIDFVMAYLAVLGGNALFAHINFRDPNARTRREDSSLNLDVLDVINRRK